MMKKLFLAIDVILGFSKNSEKHIFCSWKYVCLFKEF